jgi:hypothetical protein
VKSGWAYGLLAVAAWPWPRDSFAPHWLQFLVNAMTIAIGIGLLFDAYFGDARK